MVLILPHIPHARCTRTLNLQEPVTLEESWGVCACTLATVLSGWKHFHKFIGMLLKQSPVQIPYLKQCCRAMASVSVGVGVKTGDVVIRGCPCIVPCTVPRYSMACHRDTDGEALGSIKRSRRVKDPVRSKKGRPQPGKPYAISFAPGASEAEKMQIVASTVHIEMFSFPENSPIYV